MAVSNVIVDPDVEILVQSRTPPAGVPAGRFIAEARIKQESNKRSENRAPPISAADLFRAEGVEPGLVLKLIGRVSPGPQTSQRSRERQALQKSF